MTIETTEVSSALIKTLSFKSASEDSPHGTLRLKFWNGKVFDYLGVNERVAEGMLHAPSTGKFFHANIKGRYETVEVEG